MCYNDQHLKSSTGFSTETCQTYHIKVLRAKERFCKECDQKSTWDRWQELDSPLKIKGLRHFIRAAWRDQVALQMLTKSAFHRDQAWLMQTKWKESKMDSGTCKRQKVRQGKISNSNWQVNHLTLGRLRHKDKSHLKYENGFLYTKIMLQKENLFHMIQRNH